MEEHFADQIDGLDRKQVNHGDTALTILLGKPSLVQMVDTILYFSPEREVTQTELAELSDLSRRTISTYINLFTFFEILDTNDNGTYSFNPDGKVSKQLIGLEREMKSIRDKNMSN